MKKSLILVGMLAIGYANAQYDGKVGINTDQPKATLDLNVANVNKDKTTNEGILAPRLSKTRVANIAVPQEGTLVYVTNEADSTKLNAWLRPNVLTDDPNDFVAVPVSAGSVGITEIIAELKKEGMEIKEETAVDIITRFNRKASEMVLSGYSVNTGLAYMKPAIKGVFTDKSWNTEKHSIYVNINQGAVLREATKTAKAEILGIQDSPMSIFSITDKATGKNDGSLTKGKNAEIKGSYIKIAGENAENGIYFTNVETKVKVKVDASDIVINEPSRLMILVPNNLETGNYELSITTQYSGGNTTLKAPRTEILNGSITIA